MKKDRRRKYLVDARIQFSLAKRLLMYWCVTWLLVFVLPICVRVWYSAVPFDQLATQLISDFWFPIVLSLMILPIVAWDSIRFSNKIAGPVYRIRQTLQRHNRGQTVQAIQLRHADFCHDLASEINQVLAIPNPGTTTDPRDERAADENELQQA